MGEAETMFGSSAPSLFFRWMDPGLVERGAPQRREPVERGRLCISLLPVWRNRKDYLLAIVLD